MNRLGVLLWMPWVASARYGRLLAVLFVGGALIVACAMALTGDAHAHREVFILVLGFAVWSLWGSYLGSNLMMVRSARDLCLPRVQRDADLSLPLFAVLPGLGNGASGKRSAVTALLAPLVVFLACMCVVLCLATLALPATAWAYASLAGRPMRTVGHVLLCIVQLLLSMLLLIKAMPTDQYHGPHPELIGVVPAWLLVLWGLYLTILAILVMHGRRALRERPHVFLANTP